MKKINIKGFIRRLFPVKTLEKLTNRLPKTIGKAIRGGVYAFLVLVYISVISGIFTGVHDAFTYPDPNRPNVSLATIKAEEKQKVVDAKKAEEQKALALKTEEEEKAKEETAKKEAEDKAKLEKEEADKKAVEEAKKQEEQKKLEEEQKAQESKKAEEERLQQERQAKAEQESRQAQQARNQQKTNQVQQSGGGYWIAAYGGKIYHSRPNCRHMNHPIEIDLNYIQSNGLRACKNCHH